MTVGRILKYKPAPKYMNRKKEEEYKIQVERYEKEFPLKCTKCNSTWTAADRYFDRERSLCGGCKNTT